MTEFDQFWSQYPRRVGRLAAEEKFKAARKLATLQEILDGVERYKASKPEYADWCHPKTWLSQGRWMDEQDVAPVKTDMYGHSPPCLTTRACIDKVLADGRRATKERG